MKIVWIKGILNLASFGNRGEKENHKSKFILSISGRCFKCGVKPMTTKKDDEEKKM